MALAAKYANHPEADTAWRQANTAIKALIMVAANCDRKRADDIYMKMPEGFMNQLVDDMHKLYIIACDQ